MAKQRNQSTLDFMDKNKKFSMQQSPVFAWGHVVLYVGPGKWNRYKVEKQTRKNGKTWNLWKTSQYDQVAAFSQLSRQDQQAIRQLTIECVDEVADVYQQNGWSDVYWFIGQMAARGVLVRVLIKDKSPQTANIVINKIMQEYWAARGLSPL